MTGILFVWLSNADATKSAEALEHAADAQQTAVQEEFHHAINGLFVINRLFSSNPDLSREQFHDIATHLVENYSFVQAFSFARFVPENDRSAFEMRMQQTRETFNIVEIQNGKKVRAGNKTSYHVIEHVAPAATNAAALGLDIDSLPGGGPALERARVSGLPTATRMFNLLHETGGQRVFAVLLPVYRAGTAGRNETRREEAVIGYTIIILHAAILAEGALSRTTAQRWPDIDVSAYVENNEETELVYRTTGLTGGAADAYAQQWRAPNWLAAGKRTSATRSFDAAGMRWHIVAARAQEIADNVPASAWTALLGGSLVTVLLALYLQSLAVRAADLASANARLRDDIAARERIEVALRESEDRFHRLADLSSDWYWEQDAQFRFTLISGETIFGTMPTSELIGKTRWELPLEVEECDFEAHMALLKARKPFTDLEYRVRHTNGKTCWMSVSGEPLFGMDGEFIGYRGTGKDITARKEAELALRQSQIELRALAVHQARVKEDERRRIAREIHDDLGQNLLALRIDVSLLEGSTQQAHPELGESIRGLLEQVDNVMRSIRTIINDLRPPVLDLGLQAAIEWQVLQFGQRSGVSCALQVEGSDIDDLLDEDAAVSVFRILQESLTNVSRHAYAQHVDIHVQSRDGCFILAIADDGVGSYPDNMRKPRSFGLIGIRERVYALGGEFRVAGVPGRGTTLTIWIPATITSSATA